MSFFRALLGKRGCDECGRTDGVEEVKFDGVVKGHYCRTCRLFNVHVGD